MNPNNFLKQINIRSNRVLIVLAVLSIGGFMLVEENTIMVKSNWYEEKMAASSLSQKASRTIKNSYYGNVEFVNNFNDPNETGLIGHEYSPITSERGSIAAKLTSTNPNFAALIVQFLRDLDIQEGDNVAVGMTGSFPGLNISVCAALQTMKVNGIIICSVSSSSWGATDPDFTWLDMAKVLSDSSIMDCLPVAASIGASQDIGRGLSLEGVEMIREAIRRNNTDFIYFEDVENDIAARMQIYASHADKKPLKAYINIGGGIASLGSATNGDRIPPGLNKSLRMNVFPDKKGIIYEMSRQGIPVIHLLDIPALARANDLPLQPIPMPPPGDGKLFMAEKYDIRLVAPITAFLLSLIIFIIYQDKKNVKLGIDILRSENKIEPDELADSL